jgi:hypothetical protein
MSQPAQVVRKRVLPTEDDSQVFAPTDFYSGLRKSLGPFATNSSGFTTMPSPPLSHPGREGSFRPVTKVNMDMIRGAYERFTAEHILKTAMQPGKAWCHKK